MVVETLSFALQAKNAPAALPITAPIRQSPWAGPQGLQATDSGSHGAIQGLHPQHLTQPWTSSELHSVPMPTCPANALRFPPAASTLGSGSKHIFQNRLILTYPRQRKIFKQQAASCIALTQPLAFSSPGAVIRDGEGRQP